MNNCRIIAAGNDLAIYTPYDPAFIAALKTAVPSADRKWDGQRRAWVVNASHGTRVKLLVENYYGGSVSLPDSTGGPQATEMRLLDVRYIGAAKDRGDGQSSFAWCNGDWSVIFPKSVLLEWFGQIQAPNEASTLYGVLGVSQTAEAAELKASWRRLVRQWHPDVCREPGAREQFDAIQAAYQTLSDENRRAKYDAGLAFEAMTKAHSPLGADDSLFGVLSRSHDWRPPIRCGLILTEGQERLGRFIVSKIIQWGDIVNSQGQALVTSWATGDDHFTEAWVEP